MKARVKAPKKEEIEIPIRRVTIEELKAALKLHEEKHGLSSEVFYEKFQQEEIAETLDTIDWYMDYRAYLRAIGQLNEDT
jgi:hypothetical protein